MKRRMGDVMSNAQSDTKTRIAYDRPLDLEFPSWLVSKGEKEITE